MRSRVDESCRGPRCRGASKLRKLSRANVCADEDFYRRTTLAASFASPGMPEEHMGEERLLIPSPTSVNRRSLVTMSWFRFGLQSPYG